MHHEHQCDVDVAILTKLVVELHEAFPRICRRDNVKSRMMKNWTNLFSKLDTDGSGRLDYKEFVHAVADARRRAARVSLPGLGARRGGSHGFVPGARREPPRMRVPRRCSRWRSPRST